MMKKIQVTFFNINLELYYIKTISVEEKNENLEELIDISLENLKKANEEKTKLSKGINIIEINFCFNVFTVEIKNMKDQHEIEMENLRDEASDLKIIHKQEKTDIVSRYEKSIFFILFFHILVISIKNICSFSNQGSER